MCTERPVNPTAGTADRSGDSQRNETFERSIVIVAGSATLGNLFGNWGAFAGAIFGIAFAIQQALKARQLGHD